LIGIGSTVAKYFICYTKS